MTKYLLLFFLAMPVHATRYHHHHEPTAQPASTTTIGRSEGVALAIAKSQHNFDFGTHSWQGSIGVGSFDSESAISFGVAKRLDRVLVNGTFGFENGKVGAGLGVNWRF